MNYGTQTQSQGNLPKEAPEEATLREADRSNEADDCGSKGPRSLEAQQTTEALQGGIPYEEGTARACREKIARATQAPHAEQTFPGPDRCNEANARCQVQYLFAWSNDQARKETSY